MHPDLLAAITHVYGPAGLECFQPQMEAESSDYGAYAFDLSGLVIRFRVAKITPTKIGQFVTLWKRIGTGPIQPFDLLDPIDFFVVSCRAGENFGQFVFPKAVLCQRDIVSRDGKGGKRALRVYPPWDVRKSRQALQTQKWQSAFFVETPENRPVDDGKVRALFGKEQASADLRCSDYCQNRKILL